MLHELEELPLTRQTPTPTPLPANITRSPSGLGYLYRLNGYYISVDWILNARLQQSQWSYLTEKHNVYFLSDELAERTPTAEDNLPRPLRIITPAVTRSATPNIETDQPSISAPASSTPGFVTAVPDLSLTSESASMATVTQTTKIEETISRTGAGGSGGDAGGSGGNAGGGGDSGGRPPISRTGGGGGGGGGGRPPSPPGLSDDGSFSDVPSRDTWRPAGPGGWTERRERGNKPEKFQGDRDKSEAFLLDFGRYLRMNERVYPTESDRVDLFLSFIDHPWSVNRGREIEDDYVEREPGYRRWEELKTIRHAFKKDFGVLNEQAKAITKLEELRMEDGKIDKYVTDFETIAPRSGYNEVALLQSFKKGLTEHLRKRVNNLDPGPETLDEYKAAAVRTQTKENQEKIENALWRRKPSTYITIAAQSTDSATPPLPTQNPRSPRSPQHVVGPNGKTLLEYFQKLRRRCTGCGSDAHRKDACDQKDTTCNYCQMKGHLVRICIDKFLGRPAGGRAQSRQRVAASTETPFTLFPDEGPSIATTSDFQ